MLRALSAKDELSFAHIDYFQCRSPSISSPRQRLLQFHGIALKNSDREVKLVITKRC